MYVLPLTVNFGNLAIIHSRTHLDKLPSILSAVQIGIVLGETTIQPTFQKMLTPICLNDFSRGSLSPNSKQYFLVPALSLGMLGQKLGTVVRHYTVLKVVLVFNFLLTGRLSPLCRRDIKQNGSTRLRSHEDNICTRRPSHPYGMCHNGAK
jgi:hypothetical protein